MVHNEQLETLLKLETDKAGEAFKSYYTHLSNQYGQKTLNQHWIQYQVRRLNIDGMSLNSRYR